MKMNFPLSIIIQKNLKYLSNNVLWGHQSETEIRMEKLVTYNQPSCEVTINSTKQMHLQCFNFNMIKA